MASFDPKQRQELPLPPGALNDLVAEKASQEKEASDGSTASYYELPIWARELMDLIRYKNMNGSQAEIFRNLYRGEAASHSDDKRQAKKTLAYAVDEMVRTHFPNESMADYRDKVFEVFFPKEGADCADR